MKCSRFGASTTLQSMTEEEKMYKKMEIQRKKALKKQRFALGDDNEEEQLTHKGEAIDGTFINSPFMFQMLILNLFEMIIKMMMMKKMKN